MSEYVYILRYNPYTFDYSSSLKILSVHKTKKGAYQAMRNHKLKCYEEYRENEIYLKGEKFFRDKFGRYKSWKIEKQKIEE